jgi:hypothetical protein
MLPMMLKAGLTTGSDYLCGYNGSGFSLFRRESGGWARKFTVSNGGGSGLGTTNCVPFRHDRTFIFAFNRGIGDSGMPGAEGTPGVRYIKLRVTFDEGLSFTTAWAPYAIANGEELECGGIVKVSDGYCCIARVKTGPGAFGGVNYATGDPPIYNSVRSLVSWSADGLTWTLGSHPHEFYYWADRFDDFTAAMQNTIGPHALHGVAWGQPSGGSAVATSTMMGVIQIESFGNWDDHTFSTARPFISGNSANWFSGLSVSSDSENSNWSNSMIGNYGRLIHVPGYGFRFIGPEGNPVSGRTFAISSAGYDGAWGAHSSMAPLGDVLCNTLAVGARSDGLCLFAPMHAGNRHWFIAEGLGTDFELIRTEGVLNIANPSVVGGGKTEFYLFSSEAPSLVQVAKQVSGSWEFTTEPLSGGSVTGAICFLSQFDGMNSG